MKDKDSSIEENSAIQKEKIRTSSLLHFVTKLTAICTQETWAQSIYIEKLIEAYSILSGKLNYT
jgi:hypothetical protein